MNKDKKLKIVFAVASAIFAAAPAFAQKTQLVAVSADIVELSGSLQTARGFSWNTTFDFAEKSIPGILKIDQFERKTALATTLKLMENESKAQFLSNPKVVAKSGNQASFTVGGEFPVPVTSAQGVTVEYKKYGIMLQVLPTVLAEKKNAIDVQIKLEVSAFDSSRSIIIGSNTAYATTTRQVETEVELKSGETLVIGGIKSTTKDTTIGRVPVLGKLPLIGALFRYKEVSETQRSLFLFLTVEIVK